MRYSDYPMKRIRNNDVFFCFGFPVFDAGRNYANVNGKRREKKVAISKQNEFWRNSRPQERKTTCFDDVASEPVAERIRITKF